jgi:hypothetical protein
MVRMGDERGRKREEGGEKREERKEKSGCGLLHLRELH